MPDIATLGIAVDSRQVDQATGRLNEFTAAGGKAEKQADAFANTVKKSSNSSSEYAGEVRKLRDQMDPLNAIQLKLIENLNNVDKYLKADAIGANEAARAKKFLRDEAESAAKALEHVGGASSVTTRELIVMGREAGRGDFGRMAGSASILAQSLGLVKFALSPVGLGIIAVTAAIVGFVAAGIIYEEKMQAMIGVTEGLGRATGASADQLVAAAEKGASAAKISVSAAQEQANAYEQFGTISTKVIGELIPLTERYARSTGETAAQATKELGAAFADPVKGAQDLNAKLGFLNDTQVEEIKKLVEMNDRLGAQRILLNNLGPSLVQSSRDTESLANAWKDVWVWASNAWVAIQKAAAGYDAFAPKQRLAELNKEKDNIEAGGAPTDPKKNTGFSSWFSFFPGQSGGTGTQGNTDQAQWDHYQTILRQIADTKKEIAQSDKASADYMKNQASVAAGSLARTLQPDLSTLPTLKQQQQTLKRGIDAGVDSPQDLAVMRNAYTAVTDAINRVTDAKGNYISASQREHEVNVLTAQMNKTKDAGAKAELASKIALLKIGPEAVTNADALTRATDAGALAASRVAGHTDRHAAALARDAESMVVAAAGNFALAEAYAKGDAEALRFAASQKAATDATKKGIDIAAQTRRELDLLISQQAVSGAKAVIDLKAETGARKAANDEYEKGQVPYAVALRQAQDELKLRPLLAAAANAQGKELAALTKIINDYRKAMTAQHDEEARTEVLTVIDEENKAIAQRTKILKLDADERQIQQRLDQIDQTYWDKHGKHIAAEQLQSLRQKLQAERDLARVQAVADKLNPTARGREQGLNAIQDAGIGNPNYSKKIRDAALKQIEDYYRQIALLRALDATDAQDKAKAIADVEARYNEARLSNTEQFLTNLATLSSSKSKELQALGKAAAIIQATYDAYKAINKVMADPTIPTYVAIPLAVSIGVAAFANVAAIAGFEKGGYTGNGGTSDVAGVVHGREYVFDAQSTAAIGVGALDAMRRGAKGYRDGGFVAPISASSNDNFKPASNNSGARIEIHNYGNSKIEAQQIGPDHYRIIAREEASKAVARDAPKVISQHLKDPNSQVSKTLGEATTVARRR